MNKKR